MTARTYSEIHGYPVGLTFLNRAELAASKLHRPLQGGICGGKDRAKSIVVSGGYTDDEDYGYELVYTGQGSNDPATKRQIAHQELTLGKAGLAPWQQPPAPEDKMLLVEPGVPTPSGQPDHLPVLRTLAAS
ncbi:YDG/SRA domain-containing protein [Micromonospora chersina]|uniref:YDG/SRA domain-containing protein n=1 Tax=Micromonospora chersina TaxID=47854 RepID=UPI00378F8A48